MNYKKASFIFFVLYLFTGLLIYKDYGLNFDDGAQRQNGLVNWNYIFKNDKQLIASLDKYHGPAMEILLVGVEKAFKLTDTRDIFLAHRLVDFLVFYLSVIAFFFAARMLLGSHKWALLACLMLVLSPRIFADSFYNSKDTTFLGLMIFSLFTLLRFVAKPGFIRLLLHCLATALAIDIRILGILFIPVTLCIIIKNIAERRGAGVKYYVFVAFYLIFLAAFIILFWPILWENPLYHFSQALAQMQHFPWGGELLYAGSFVMATRLPWHYLPVWILISTPVFISLFWMAGWVLLVKEFTSAPLLFLRKRLIWACIFLLTIAPVIMVLLLKSVVYDAWRHVFFIYPFYVLISVYGFKTITENVTGLWGRAINMGAVAYLAMLAVVCIYMHPFENVYFNFPALVCFNPINKQFEMDYWGLSYKQGLQYVLRSNPNNNAIKLYEPNGPGIWNRDILKEDERGRLDFKQTMGNGEYFVTNHRFEHQPAAGSEKIVYEIRKFGNPVVTVYKL